MEVRTDLHRAVAGVEHGQRHQIPVLEQHDVAVAEEDLAGDEPGGTVVGGASGSERRRLDRSVQGHELGPVGEGRLGLELVDQRLHPLHHVGGVEHVAPGGHDLRDRHAVTGRLEHPGGEHRHRLGVVEQQPALPAAPRHLRRAGDHQPFLFVGCEQHRFRRSRSIKPSPAAAIAVPIVARSAGRCRMPKPTAMPDACNAAVRDEEPQHVGRRMCGIGCFGTMGVTVYDTGDRHERDRYLRSHRVPGNECTAEGHDRHGDRHFREWEWHTDHPERAARHHCREECQRYRGPFAGDREQPDRHHRQQVVGSQYRVRQSALQPVHDVSGVGKRGQRRGGDANGRADQNSDVTQGSIHGIEV